MNPLLTALLSRYSVQVQELMDLLEAKRITPKVWRDQMAILLSRYHYASMMVGMGSTAVPPEGLAILASTLGSQFGYLDNFYTQVAAAEAFRNTWRSRAQMYTRSASSSFWDGYIYSKAGRFLPVPSTPGDGSTQCLSNCRCSLRVVPVDAAAGDFDVYWELNPAEHCQTCIERGKQWSPLRIRDGVLVEGGLTAVKHLAGQHDQLAHGGGGHLGRFEDFAKSNMTREQLTAVRGGLAKMSEGDKKAFFEDAMENMQSYQDPGRLVGFMVNRAKPGKKAPMEKIGTSEGADVLRVRKYDKFPTSKNMTVAVGIRGHQDRGTILSADGDLWHNGMVRNTGGQLDNYVRFKYGSLGDGRRGLIVDVNTAASVDPEKGLNNIYKALDRLYGAGVPRGTVVNIINSIDGTVIDTTVKQWNLQRA